MKFSLCIQFFSQTPVVLCILDAYCTLVLRSTRVCIYCMCIVIRSRVHTTSRIVVIIAISRQGISYSTSS